MGHRTDSSAQGLWHGQVNTVSPGFGPRGLGNAGANVAMGDSDREQPNIYCCLRIRTLGSGVLVALGIV